MTTTLDNEQSSFDAARQMAEEALRKLKAQQEQDLPWITKPLLGEHKTLWFDAGKFKEDTAPNKFAKTEENPNPTRNVYIFTVKTKSGQEKPFTLEPSQAMEVFQILSRKDGGCSWIEVSREPTKKGGSKLSFLAL